MAPLLDLDDPACRDVRRAGAKAAALARARAAGLPALGGVVLPVSEASGPFAAAAASLAAGGSGAARLALIEAPLDDELVAALRSAGTSQGPRIVVRSSSPLEAEGAWSGAFTSYTDATPEDLPTLVRGCWASAFNLDVLERWQAAGLDAGQLAMAVLIQPALALDAGGLATIGPGGSVTVVGMRGPPDALMAGWAPGHRAVVAPDGAVALDAGDGIDEALAGRVAMLSRRVLERLQTSGVGFSSIEWGLADGELYLLQAQRGTPAEADASSATVDAAYRTPEARRVAAHVLACRGPLGDALVLPWALALPGSTWPGPTRLGPLSAEPVAEPAADPAESLARIRALASDLIARTWRRPAPQASQAAAGLLADLAGSSPERGLRRLPDLRPAGRDAGSGLLAAIQGLAAALVERGAIPHPESIWGCTPEQLELLVAGEALEPTVAPGTDRWRWLLYATASAQGEPASGMAASPGTGAGRLRLLRTEADAAAFRPGEVIVARYPLNWMAPLLWGAAGLVTTGGSRAAHLIEVARWLKVPAVVHCPLPEPDTETARTLLAVDGDRGEVSLLRP